MSPGAFALVNVHDGICPFVNVKVTLFDVADVTVAPIHVGVVDVHPGGTVSVTVYGPPTLTLENAMKFGLNVVVAIVNGPKDPVKLKLPVPPIVCFMIVTVAVGWICELVIVHVLV